MSRVAVLLALTGLIAVAACVAAGDTITWRNLSPSSSFRTTSVTLTTTEGAYQPGATATMVVKGDVLVNVNGGHVDMQIWELNVAKYTARNDYQYCECHGYPAVCNECMPINLIYDNCNNPSSFTLTMGYIMPQPQSTANYTVSLLSNHAQPELELEVYYTY